jgi:hypothetical protein
MNKCLFCLDHLSQFVPIVQDFEQQWMWKAVIMGVKSNDNYKLDAELGVHTLGIESLLEV